MKGLGKAKNLKNLKSKKGFFLNYKRNLSSNNKRVIKSKRDFLKKSIVVYKNNKNFIKDPTLLQRTIYPHPNFNEFTYKTRYVFRSQPTKKEKLDEIFEDGMTPKGDIDSIKAFIGGNTSGPYISFGTRYGSVASQFGAKWRAHLLVAQKPEICIDVPHIARLFITETDGLSSDQGGSAAEYASTESEMTAVGKIKGSDFLMARPVIGGLVGPYIFYGDPIVNKNFKPRPFSIEILSANEKEALLLQQQLKEIGLLAHDKKYLTFEQAQLLAKEMNMENTALEQDGSIYLDLPTFDVTVIDKGWGTQEIVDKVMEEYQQRNRVILQEAEKIEPELSWHEALDIIGHDLHKNKSRVEIEEILDEANEETSKKEMSEKNTSSKRKPGK